MTDKVWQARAAGAAALLLYPSTERDTYAAPRADDKGAAQLALQACAQQLPLHLRPLRPAVSLHNVSHASHFPATSSQSFGRHAGAVHPSHPGRAVADLGRR